jgi:hypothetical protein
MRGQTMTAPSKDQRGPERRACDEQVAAEAPLAPLDLPADASGAPVETHLGRRRRPVAIAGVVENGLVQPLDPSVKLPEHAWVIIVAAESA